MKYSKDVERSAKFLKMNLDECSKIKIEVLVNTGFTSQGTITEIQIDGEFSFVTESCNPVTKNGKIKLTIVSYGFAECIEEVKKLIEKAKTITLCGGGDTWYTDVLKIAEKPKVTIL